MIKYWIYPQDCTLLISQINEVIDVCNISIRMLQKQTGLSKLWIYFNNNLPKRQMKETTFNKLKTWLYEYSNKMQEYWRI